MVVGKMLFSLVLAVAGPDEFDDQLARLAAPAANERAAAERWLQAHMTFERYPDVATTAKAGDAEVRGRLARVLGSDARHLAVALALCGERDAGLQALGRESVRASVGQAEPRLARQAVRGLDLGPWLREVAAASPPRDVLLDSKLPLERLVEELELVAELPFGMTLDARVATATIRRSEELASGPWNEVLLNWVEGLGVELECHGPTGGRGFEPPAVAFLRLTTKAEAPRTGVDWISEWLFALASEGDVKTRARAARNLASSGFAPAIAWMDHLVRTKGDVAAREGVLRAAARGRVAPSLTSPPVLQALLAELETGSVAESARILCGLARLGCLDAGGNGLATRLLSDFDRASPRGRWARLYLVERNGCQEPGIEPLARRLLVDPATPAPLRLQALAGLASQGAAPCDGPVDGLGSLFRLELDAVAVERLARALVFLRLRPPYREPGEIPAEWTDSERLALLQAWLWAGEAEAVAAHLLAWLQSSSERQVRGEGLARELEPWLARGAAPLVDRALQLARAKAPGEESAVARVRLLLGLVPVAELSQLLVRGAYPLSGDRSDLALLGALAGYPEEHPSGEASRATLLALLLRETSHGDPGRPLMDALLRAAQGLFAAGRDEVGESFSGSVNQALRRSRSGAGRRRSTPTPWPPAPTGPPLDLSHALARFAVPASL